jgi:hypothetical protein
MAIEYKTVTIAYFVDGDFSCKVSYLLDLYDRLECSTVFNGDIDWDVYDYLKSHNYIRSYIDVINITPSGREFFEGLSK